MRIPGLLCAALIVALSNMIAEAGGSCDLTDEKIIAAAVEFYVDELQPSTYRASSSEGAVVARYHPYRSAQELIDSNPDCCSISHELAESTSTDREKDLYDFYGTVRIQPDLVPIVPAQVNPLEGFAWGVPMDSCGHVILEMLVR